MKKALQVEIQGEHLVADLPLDSLREVLCRAWKEYSGKQNAKNILRRWLWRAVPGFAGFAELVGLAGLAGLVGRDLQPEQKQTIWGRSRFPYTFLCKTMISVHFQPT